MEALERYLAQIRIIRFITITDMNEEESDNEEHVALPNDVIALFFVNFADKSRFETTWNVNPRRESSS